MIYTNADGIWFRCSCTKKDTLLVTKQHPVITMVMLKEIVAAHGHH